MIEVIRKNRFLFIPISISLLYFIRKAVQYGMIDSYGPLILVITIIFLLLTSLKINRTRFLQVVKIWAIFVAIWSSLRIFISIAEYITKTFDEYHLKNQFGISNIIISFTMLLLAIIIIRYSHKKRLNAWL